MNTVQFDDDAIPRDSACFSNASACLSNVSSHVSFSSDGADSEIDVANSGAFKNKRASQSMSRKKRSSVSMYRSKRSEHVMDIGFLAQKFGKGKSNHGWFSKGKGGMNERFEAAITRGSDTVTRSGSVSRTILKAFCAGMSAEKKRREEFIAEMRLLSTLR